ncbi:MAG: metallophosphoesterase family protein, partial [Ktedonobacterales bacterium]
MNSRLGGLTATKSACADWSAARKHAERRELIVAEDTCIAVFGGVYNNYLALEAVLRDAQRRGATAFYCLGDMGGFGPCPDKVFPILHEFGVTCI